MLYTNIIERGTKFTEGGQNPPVNNVWGGGTCQGGISHTMTPASSSYAHVLEVRMFGQNLIAT